MVSLPRKCEHCHGLIYHYGHCVCFGGQLDQIKDERESLVVRSAQLDEIERALRRASTVPNGESK